MRFLRMDAPPRRVAPAEDRGELGAFALCSFFLLFSAAAGFAAASFVPPGGGEAGLFSAWELPFGPLLLRLLAPALAALLLGFSCFGCLLLPLASGAAGFLTAFTLCAAARRCGEAAGVFRGPGLLLPLLLPFWLLLFSAGARLSLGVLRAALFGARPLPGAGRRFLGALALCGLVSVLCAAAFGV